MAIKWILTISLIFALANNIFAQHTDLKEYGLKGKVKRITTMHYTDVMFVDGQWMPISFEAFSLKTMLHFNEQGYIDTSMTSFFFEPESLVSNTLAYEFKNGKKVSGKYYDFSGMLIQHHQISWTDQYTYTTTATDINGIKLFESTSWLNDAYRDIKGDYKSYQNGELIFYEKYSDIFDENGQLIEAEFTNVLENKKYHVLYKHIEFDKNNNPTISTLINITDGTIKKMILREIEYY